MLLLTVSCSGSTNTGAVANVAESTEVSFGSWTCEGFDVSLQLSELLTEEYAQHICIHYVTEAASLREAQLASGTPIGFDVDLNSEYWTYRRDHSTVPGALYRDSVDIFFDKFGQDSQKPDWGELGLREGETGRWGDFGIGERDWEYLREKIVSGELPKLHDLYFPSSTVASTVWVGPDDPISGFRYWQSPYDFHSHDSHTLSVALDAYSEVLNAFSNGGEGWPLFAITWDCFASYTRFFVTCESILCYPDVVEDLASIPAQDLTHEKIDESCHWAGLGDYLTRAAGRTLLGRQPSTESVGAGQ